MTIEAAGGNVRIRRMTLDDIPEAHAIDVLSFAMPWSERSFVFELTENPAARVWVAEWTGPDGSRRLAGILALWLIIDEAHIGTIAVHPEFRQLGIGRRLLAEALLGAAADGAEMSFLEVRRGNIPAQNLYMSFGYVQAGVRPRYYRDNGEDALLMNLNQINPDALRAQLAQFSAGQEAA